MAHDDSDAGSVGTRSQSAVDVVAAVLWRNGRVLVCRRPEGVQLAGQWEFPGGKVNSGETRPEAMARELVEELALELTRYGPERFVFETTDGAFRLHFVEVAVTGEPEALEHSALAWLRPEELGHLALASGDRAFADAWIEQGWTPS